MMRRTRNGYIVISHLRHLWPIALLIILSGCSSMGYYWQAISGHLEIKSREQPISELLASPELDGVLREKLLLAQQARRFASAQLALPENDSYTTYADLERPFVVWNVVATPPFSIEAKQWCYVFVGCVSYRGFFVKEKALAYQAVLREGGLDVALAGAAAYSTLGYFDDPLLNTMLRREEAELIGVIFHELAHQLVYVEGDTAFNEAFATTVEQEGLRRWYAQHGDEVRFQHYLQDKLQREAVVQLLIAARGRLDQLYRDEADPQVKLARKGEILTGMKNDYYLWRTTNSYAGFDNWFKQELNNAHLALVATYQAKVPHFMAMLDTVKGDLPMFYAKVMQLAELSPAARSQALQAYSKQE